MLQRLAVALVSIWFLIGTPANAADEPSFERRIHVGAGYLTSGSLYGVGPEISFEMLWPGAHVVLIPSAHTFFNPFLGGLGLQIGPTFRLDGKGSTGDGVTLDLQALVGGDVDLTLFRDVWVPFPSFTAGMAAGVTIWSAGHDLVCLRLGGGIKRASLSGSPAITAHASIALPLH